MISHRICWASTCATVSISLGLALESFGQKLPRLQQSHFITSHFFPSNSIQFPVGLRCAWGATAAHSDTRRCWPAASLLGLTMPILVAHNLTEDRFDKEHVAYVCVCNYMCVIVRDCRWLYMYMHVCVIICMYDHDASSLTLKANKIVQNIRECLAPRLTTKDLFASSSAACSLTATRSSAGQTCQGESRWVDVCRRHV